MRSTRINLIKIAFFVIIDGVSTYLNNFICDMTKKNKAPLNINFFPSAIKFINKIDGVFAICQRERNFSVKL